MRFAVDAHAIGRHLTGNEVYVRSLLNAFGAQDRDCEFVAYVSAEDAPQLPAVAHPHAPGGAQSVSPAGFRSWPCKVREDRPDLLHVQYTAPLGCPVPVVVSVHDVSFLEHPEYFTRDRAWQLQWTVRRTVQRAAQDSDRQRVLAVVDSEGVWRSGRGQGGGGAERRGARSSGRSRGRPPRPRCASASGSPRRSFFRWAICSRARTRSA